MPTTDMRATQARDIVSSLEQQLDLGSWPDPQMVWFSSSVSERHPGKRYHPSSWCVRLRAVHKVEYRKAFSEVAAQFCYECFAVTDETVEQYTRHRLHELLGKFESIAAGIGDAQQLPCATISAAQRSVSAIEQHGPRSARVRAAAAACAQALATLVSLGTSSGDPTGSDQAVFAARLLESARPSAIESWRTPEVYAPPSTRGGQLLPRVESAFSGEWSAFVAALSEGHTPRQAAAAATAVVSTAKPLGIERLATLEVTATRVGQQFTLVDLLALWQEQVALARALIIEDWVCAVNENIARSDAVGLVRVRLKRDVGVYSVHPTGSAMAAATSGRYPTELGATLSVEVPAALAAVLLRENNGTFEPNSNCSEDMLKVAHDFRKDRMDPLTALVTAKAVVAEPARSQALAA